MSEEISTKTPKKTDKSADVLYSMGGGVWTPFAISAISGGLAFLIVLLAFDKISLRLAAGLGVGVTTFAWWKLNAQRMQNISEAFLHWAEITTKTDINKDGVIGTQKPKEILYRVQTAKDGAFRETRYSPPFPDMHEELAKRTLRGVTFAQKNYMRGPDAIMTLDEFNELKEYLLNRDLIRLKDPRRKNSSTEWTDEGLYFMEQIATAANSPTLAEEI
jgi:hypothetical protein